MQLSRLIDRDLFLSGSGICELDKKRESVDFREQVHDYTCIIYTVSVYLSHRRSILDSGRTSIALPVGERRERKQSSLEKSPP